LQKYISKPLLATYIIITFASTMELMTTYIQT